jgi:hypothetical protein
MRGKVSFILVVGFVVSLLFIFNSVQAEEKKAQLFLVEEVTVKPSMVAKYEAHVQNVLDVCKRHPFPYPWTAFNSDDLHYFFVWQIDNYASVDSWFKALEGWLAQVGEETALAIQKETVGAYKHLRYSCYRHVPEMSYHPETPRLKPGEANFVYMGYCYVIGGNEAEVKEHFKEIVDFCKKTSYSVGWDAYAGEFGTDSPMFIYLMYGKNASEFWTEVDKFHGAHGEGIEKLWSKTLSLLRKYEYKTGLIRPDLSLMPEEK